MNRTRTLAIGLVLIAALSLSACGLFRRATPKIAVPTPTPTVQSVLETPVTVVTLSPSPEPVTPHPHPVIGYTPVPSDTISPVVVQRSPEVSEELAPDSGLQLVFDRAMNPSAVEAAFVIQPAVAGKITWSDKRTLTWKPNQPLSRDTVYDVVLSQNARAADGAPLRSAYSFRFATAGYLQVGQVMPAPETTDVEANARITVIFNRPVVPLTSLGQQANLPQPLSLNPSVPGKGQWLNTSIYVFQPDAPLPGGVTFTAKVGGLKDADGNPMESDYSWRFTTQPPKVVWVQPNDKATQMRIETNVRVQFNQPVDPASAQQAFSLKAAGKLVPGALSVLSDTLTFTPTARLPFDTQIEALVAAGVKSAIGGNPSPASYAWSFRTVPLPRIVETNPKDGERNASPYTSFTIRFNISFLILSHSQ